MKQCEQVPSLFRAAESGRKRDDGRELNFEEGSRVKGTQYAGDRQQEKKTKRGGSTKVNYRRTLVGGECNQHTVNLKIRPPG